MAVKTPRRQSERAPLPYGPFALALYAAPDLPYPERNRMPHQELSAHAAQGANRLGGVGRVRDLYDDLLSLNRRFLRDVIDADTYRAQVAKLLQEMDSAHEPDLARFEQCVAYDYRRLCPA